MHDIDYDHALEPLLARPLPPHWTAAVLADPDWGISMGKDDDGGPELQFTLADEQPVATRMVFLYYRGIDADDDPSARQIRLEYHPDSDDFALWSLLTSTTVASATAASDWLDNQFSAVEGYVTTQDALGAVADDVEGLGRTGVRGLAERFQSVDAIRAATPAELATVPYVTEAIGQDLQAALDEWDDPTETPPGERERTFAALDGPIVVDSSGISTSGLAVDETESDPDEG